MHCNHKLGNALKAHLHIYLHVYQHNICNGQSKKRTLFLKCSVILKIKYKKWNCQSVQRVTKKCDNQAQMTRTTAEIYNSYTILYLNPCMLQWDFVWVGGIGTKTATTNRILDIRWIETWLYDRV